MGSGSSTAKKTVICAEVEPGEDIKAIKHIKDETKSLEDIRTDKKRLKEFIEKFNHKQNAKSEVVSKDNEPLITDRVGSVVDDLVGYIDRINASFDELQGSLQLFQDAIVKLSEESKSEQSHHNSNGDIKDIIKELDKKIKLAKERTADVKTKNVTHETVNCTQEEIKVYVQMREQLERENQSLNARKDDLINQLKENGLSSETIESIMKWKADESKVESEFGHILAGKQPINEEQEKQIKDLEERNNSLKIQLDTIQQQCDQADVLVEKANDNVQRVEEKILEERLSHEVEINALKALIEKKNRLIKQLGGSEWDSPSPTASSPIEKLNDTDMKQYDSVIENSSSQTEKTDEPPDQEKDTETNNNEYTTNNQTEAKTKQINSGVLTDEINGESLTDDDKAKFMENDATDSERTSRDVLIAIDQSPRQTLDENESNSKAESIDTDRFTSIGVQVSNDDHIKDENMKMDEKEQTSSDLGMSVKSEFNGNTHDLYDADDETNNETSTTSEIKSPVENKGESIHVLQMQQPVTTPNGTVLPTASQANVADDAGDRHESKEDDFIESFADMIQLVSKDECITALETTEDDVHHFEGTTKEIIYKRSDGGIDWNVAYHKGIGAVIRTTHPDFGIDTIRVDIIDEVESSMLPDLVLGERPISFHLHIRQKDGVSLDLQENEVKVFVPHRPLKEYEDVTLIYTLNGVDWEDCDLVEELPASVDSEDLDIVGTVLPSIQDVKLVVIARERMVDLMAGEGDISYLSSFDESIRVNISNDTFRSHTIAKLLVHHSHILGLESAVIMHEECRCIASCTAFVSIVCATVTRDNILVVMDVPDSGINEDNDCRYIMFCLTESGWRLADCTWDLANRRLTINLMPGSRTYRIIGVDVPDSIHMEERLCAVKSLHEHTNHYQVCVFVRQRLDDPQQAVVMCLRAHLVDQALLELVSKGFSMGHLISEIFCIMDGDDLSIEVAGNMAAKPVNSDKMTMTFYPQREMSTKLLLLLPVEADDTPGMISVIKHELDDNLEVLSGKISLTPDV